jgi:hypothetical protein
MGNLSCKMLVAMKQLIVLPKILLLMEALILTSIHVSRTTEVTWRNRHHHVKETRRGWLARGATRSPRGCLKPE